MPDYITENGELQESKELIRRKVKAYLDTLGPNIPILKARDTALGRALLARKSACITYDTLAQAHAHIRAAMRQYARAHYSRGDWKLDFILTDSNSLMSAYLGSEKMPFTGARLTTVPLLIIEAPTWQRAKANKDHAATLLQQRMGARRSTFIYSYDFQAFTTGCVNNPRSFSPEFNEVLLESADFEHITLIGSNFANEVRDWNGYTEI